MSCNYGACRFQTCKNGPEGKRRGEKGECIRGRVHYLSNQFSQKLLENPKNKTTKDIEDLTIVLGTLP